jgi:hypothetical protein
MAVMRVGVAGHRWNRIDPQSERLRLASVLHDAMAELPGADGPATLVTGMAEGTDLTAAAVRPAHWTLEAVLALPEEKWRDHLATAPGVEARDRADYARLMDGTRVVVPGIDTGGPDYVAIASYLASTCTCLVVVWNGKDGPPGGTSDVVARGRASGVPVVNLWQDLLALR